MASALNFNELSNDKDFVSRATNLEEALQSVEFDIRKLNQVNYELLSTEDKIKFDLFRAYSINALFWIFLKLQGIDPSQVGYLFSLYT